MQAKQARIRCIVACKQILVMCYGTSTTTVKCPKIDNTVLIYTPRLAFNRYAQHSSRALRAALIGLLQADKPGLVHSSSAVGNEVVRICKMPSK
jgi:hypothetical protein